MKKLLLMLCLVLATCACNGEVWAQQSQTISQQAQDEIQNLKQYYSSLDTYKLASRDPRAIFWRFDVIYNGSFYQAFQEQHPDANKQKLREIIINTLHNKVKMPYEHAVIRYHAFKFAHDVVRRADIEESLRLSWIWMGRHFPNNSNEWRALMVAEAISPDPVVQAGNLSQFQQFQECDYFVLNKPKSNFTRTIAAMHSCIIKKGKKMAGQGDRLNSMFE